MGYDFARKVQQQIHVPIGLVVDPVGGSPAEAWASEAALRPLHDFDLPLAELDRLKAENAPEYGNYVMHWYDRSRFQVASPISVCPPAVPFRTDSWPRKTEGADHLDKWEE